MGSPTRNRTCSWLASYDHAVFCYHRLYEHHQATRQRDKSLSEEDSISH